MGIPWGRKRCIARATGAANALLTSISGSTNRPLNRTTPRPPTARVLSCRAGALARRHDGTDAPRNLWLLWWNVPRGTGTNGRDGRRSGARREPIGALRHTVGKNAPSGLFTITEKGRRCR
jgi:hypothetical protein